MTFEQLLALVGCITGVLTIFASVGIWWSNRRERRFHDALKRASDEGRRDGSEAALVEVQAKATARMFERLEFSEREIEWLKSKIHELELLMSHADILVPPGSQVGPEGRGSKNPLLDPRKFPPERKHP